MSDEAIYRRTPSAASMAMRSERKLLLPVRKKIGELQKRAAFVEAKARLTRYEGVEERAAEVDDIRKAVIAAREMIADLMEEGVSVGPAEDCRKAVSQIETRLRAL